MKVTKQNVFDLPIGKSDQRILRALLDDIDEINNAKVRPRIYINWIDKHTEYSPERTEPCPDYYGMYTILSVKDSTEILGVEMDIDTLDCTLCLLHNYIIGI